MSNFQKSAEQQGIFITHYKESSQSKQYVAQRILKKIIHNHKTLSNIIYLYRFNFCHLSRKKKTIFFAQNDEKTTGTCEQYENSLLLKTNPKTLKNCNYL